MNAGVFPDIVVTIGVCAVMREGEARDPLGKGESGERDSVGDRIAGSGA
jgi:hypothetical protein